LEMSSKKIVKKSGYRKKGGTHGALSKAGKLRSQNPRDWKLRRRTKEGNPQKHLRKHKSPKLSGRKRYEKMKNKPKRRFERLQREFR